ncbi:CDP-alcohol phosphatidyltransferase family protein [Sorangium sp. So ce260]|uniref:CDP-alcohol phosphatidyltransferase family protein n=1 Tax=Sorangium sp. So ce260 TaxID=3133291 RepID=UPI003F5FAA53
MPEPCAATESSTPAAQSGGVPGGWKMRMEDPFNRYYRYPIARWIVRALMKTPVTPNQVSLVQPLFAALAGYLVTFDDPRRLVAGALVFELRSILDCVDGALARAKRMASPAGHAIDALADWLGVTFLYAGIFWHFHLHPPPDGPWSAVLSTNSILLLALLQGALRSFSADYFKLKYCSIFERGTDETVDALRRKIQALGPSSSFFAHAEVFIGRMGHLAFEHEWFDPERSRSSTTADQMKQLIREETSPLTRLIGALWAISNGDAFLSMVVLTLLANQLWLGQVFFATGGVVWVAAVIFLNGWFLRASRRGKLAVA